jgi:hypothetical protein
MHFCRLHLSATTSHRLDACPARIASWIRSGGEWLLGSCRLVCCFLYGGYNMQHTVPTTCLALFRGCMWYSRRELSPHDEWEIAQGMPSQHVCQFVCATPAARTRDGIRGLRDISIVVSPRLLSLSFYFAHYPLYIILSSIYVVCSVFESCYGVTKTPWLFSNERTKNMGLNPCI